MRKKLILFISFYLGTIASLAQMKVTIHAPSQTTEGTTIQVRYAVNSTYVDGILVDEFPGFELIGGPTSSSGNSSQSQRFFTYTLRAIKAGTYKLPTATIWSNGRTYKSNQHNITILAKKREINSSLSYRDSGKSDGVNRSNSNTHNINNKSNKSKSGTNIVPRNTSSVHAKNSLPHSTSTNEHDYVDLGLPSGTLWATCNIGASSPEDYGGYFAWGETEVKDNYDWSTYKWCNGSNTTLTKYNNDSNYGMVDKKEELELSDDAAYVNWGSNWRMPSLYQLKELFDSRYITTIWTTQNGVYGCKITSKTNGNSIFLPSAGFRNGASLYYAGSDAIYWSRTHTVGHPDDVESLYLSSKYVGTNDNRRCFGRSVRPVRAQ